MKAMIGFTKGLMSMPMPWPLWIGLLLVINIAGPLSAKRLEELGIKT